MSLPPIPKGGIRSGDVTITGISKAGNGNFVVNMRGPAGMGITTTMDSQQLGRALGMAGIAFPGNGIPGPGAPLSAAVVKSSRASSKRALGKSSSQFAGSASSVALVMHQKTQKKNKSKSGGKSAKPWKSVQAPGHMRNSAAAARLIACPDELYRVGEDLPTVPTSHPSPRYEHSGTLLTELSLANNNLLVQVPGQTLWCARVATAIGDLAAGSLIALNMGDPTLQWSMADAGLTALPTSTFRTTLRLVPRYHLGYLASAPAGEPQPPQIVEFSTGTSNCGVYFSVYDGAGNSAYIVLDRPKQCVCTIIGDIVPTSGSTVSHAGDNYTTSSFLTVDGFGMTVKPIILETGGPVRELLQFSGPMYDDPADDSFFPNATISSNIRLEILQSALENSFSLVSYAVPSGNDGPFPNRVEMSETTTVESIVPSWSYIASRSRQHSMGELNIASQSWYAANIATRIGRADIGMPAIADFGASPAACPDTRSQSAINPVQAPDWEEPPINSNLLSWSHQPVISLTRIRNGKNSGTDGYPVAVQAIAWIEALVPPESGLHVDMPLYCPEFVNWMQVINTYPVLARADSFKDFLSAAFQKAKEVASFVGGRVLNIAKTVLRDSAVEALLTGAEMLAM